MRLTQKLLGYLNRVFDKDPGRFLALRFRYDDGMTWRIEDGVLTTVVTGGLGEALTIDLAQHTLRQLAEHIAARTGYEVVYLDAANAGLSSLVLLDAEGDQDTSNGDHLYGFTSILWAWMEAAAIELREARIQIEGMPAEMSVGTARGYWLDVLGKLYGFPRESILVSGLPQLEPDNLYGPRIIYEVLRPRGNNIALELAIENATGQSARVIDASVYGDGLPKHNSAITHNAANFYDSSAAVQYGLFDVVYSFDLEGAEDIAPFTDRVVETIERFRDAGTHLRQLSLSGSLLSDAPAPPADGAVALTVFITNYHNGAVAHDGAITYSGSTPHPETLP